jgi:hypothetical protein
VTGSITIREAIPADLDVVMHHRRRMFEDMGHRAPAALDAMEVSSRPIFARGLADGSDSLGFTSTNEMRLAL